jgi:hypothetical protein
VLRAAASRQRTVVLCAVSSVVLAGAPTAAASLGSSGPEIAPCLQRHHLPTFTAYSLGASFAGLSRTNMSRSCYAPPPGRLVGTGSGSVTWVSDAVYGTCTPEGFEGGCGPPLDVQSWPECDRNFSSNGTVESAKTLRPTTSDALTGSYKIPAVQLEKGLSNRIEMYTGTTTIVIFTDGPEGPRLALRAAHALARIVARSVASISGARLRALAVSTRGCRAR